MACTASSNSRHKFSKLGVVTWNVGLLIGMFERAPNLCQLAFSILSLGSKGGSGISGEMSIEVNVAMWGLLMQCSNTFQSVMGAIVGDTRVRVRVLLSIVVGMFNLFDKTKSELS